MSSHPKVNVAATLICQQNLIQHLAMTSFSILRIMKEELVWFLTVDADPDLVNWVLRVEFIKTHFMVYKSSGSGLSCVNGSLEYPRVSATCAGILSHIQIRTAYRCQEEKENAAESTLYVSTADFQIIFFLNFFNEFIQ